MPVTELLLQGVELMLLGMGLVFGFLAVLVLATVGMSRVGQRLEPPREKPVAPASSGAAREAAPDDTLIAVIAAAVDMFRTTQK